MYWIIEFDVENLSPKLTNFHFTVKSSENLESRAAQESREREQTFSLFASYCKVFSALKDWLAFVHKKRKSKNPLKVTATSSLYNSSAAHGRREKKVYLYYRKKKDCKK